MAHVSETLALELRPRGIRVMTVYPGPVETPMADRNLARYENNPTRGMPVGSPSELARRIARGVQNYTPRIVYPRVYYLTRWFPTTTRCILENFAPMPKSLVGELKGM